MIDVNVTPAQDPSIVGEMPATEEQQAVLDRVMDTLEQAIHGGHRDDVVNTIKSHPELWMSVSQLATGFTMRVAHQMDEQQIQYDPSVFFGQNGAIQQTVEMLWEIADSMNHPAAEDDDQFNAAYMATLQHIGEMLVEDEDSAQEAQAFLLQQELGEDVVGLSANEMEQIAAQENPQGVVEQEDAAGLLERMMGGGMV